MTVTDYRNFDLLITRSGERYRAFVVDAPGGDANITFDLPFDPKDMGSLSALTGIHRGVGDKPTPGTKTALTTLGRQLFEAIFRDEVAAVLSSSLTTVAQEKAGLRLRLRFEEDAADLAGLPWETLYDPALSHFIGLGEASPILRYLAMPRSRPALLVEPPLRVLAVLSSPAGLPSLDMDREWEVLQTSLVNLVADGKFVVERLETPSLAALQNRLLGEPVHILHFVGHGIFDETSQTGSLVLEDAQGNPQLVRGEQMAALLRNHPALRLIYLNACEGALASGQSVFTGVAQTLVREGVPAAVAMQAEISDTGAIELARTFYTALAAGRPVDAALTQARVALSVADSPEWAIPVLFSRSPDNRLFDIREVLPTPDCPYPGMVPFTEAQQDLFFGRDKEIGEAVDRLRQHPFLTVVGPSGSGKSSLIYAGVIPALRASRRFGPGQWAVKIMRPGQHPLAALTERLGCSPQTLASLALTERTLLFVDQFEETFTLAEVGEAQTFLDSLQALICQPNLTLLLTVRADFYPDLMACSLWQPIRANRLELTPLGDDELWAAIVEPAARVGVTVDEALAVQLIADAAGQSGVLPLVQESLVLLWEKVERRQLGLAAYRQMAEGGRSGLQVAIDRRATVVYENLPDPARPIARRIFLRLIQFGEGRADTRRQQSVADLRASGDEPALFDRTLARLIDSRLLTASSNLESATRRLDISHEALISGWGHLQRWLGEKRQTEGVRRRLEEKVIEWLRLNKMGGLLDEYELYEANAWRTQAEPDQLGVSDDLLALLAASQAAIEAREVAAEEAYQRELRQQRQLAEEQAKAASSLRRRAQLLAAVGILAVILAVAAGIFGRNASINATQADYAKSTAIAETHRAEAQLQISRSREVAATARGLLDDGQSQKALLLSVAAITHITDTVEANNTLRAALEEWRGVAEISGHTQRTFIVTSDNGQYMASSDESGLVRVWQMVGKRRAINLVGHTGRITANIFSPDSTFLVTTSADGSIRVWNPSTGDLLFSPMYQSGNPDDPQEIKSADLSRNGSVLVTRGVDNLRVWDLTTGQALDPEPFTTGADLRAAAVSPSGEFMAATSADGLAGFWQISSRINVRLPGSDLTSFSNDGLYWATTSGPTLHLWDMINGLVEVLIPDRAMSANISALAFSKDGRFLASGAQDGTIRLWDLRQLSRPARILRGHTEQITSLNFSPDNRFLATTSLDDTARMWRVENGVQETLLTGHDAKVWSVAFSPDSRQIVTSDERGVIRLWQVQVGGYVAHLDLTDVPATDLVMMDSEGDRLALAGDGSATIWHPGTDQLETLPLGDEIDFETIPQFTAIAFRADDSMLLLGTSDGELIRMDATVGKMLDRQPAHENGVSRLLAPNLPGGDILSAGGDGFIRRWEGGGGDLVSQWMAHPGGVTDLAVAGDLLLSGGYDGRVRLWQASTETLSVTLALTQTTTLVGDASQTGDPLAPVLGVALSADGRLIAAGGRGQGIFLWDRSAPEAEPTIIPISAAVRTLAFAPDGRTLVSGDESGLLRLWNLESGRAVQVGKRSGSWVGRATFSLDGRALFSVDQAGGVYMWPVPTADLVDLACARAIRDLTLAERAEYLSFLTGNTAICPAYNAVAWDSSQTLDPPRPTPAYTIGSPLGDQDPPQIYYFDSINGTHIQSGDEITLRWRAENATEVYLEIAGQRQGVTSPNEMRFTPITSTLYRLIVVNSNGQRSQNLKVTVGE